MKWISSLFTALVFLYEKYRSRFNFDSLGTDALSIVSIAEICSLIDEKQLQRILQILPPSITENVQNNVAISRENYISKIQICNLDDVLVQVKRLVHDKRNDRDIRSMLVTSRLIQQSLNELDLALLAEIDNSTLLTNNH